MISSFYDGRVRIKADALKEPEKMQMLHDMVAAQEGVTELVPNPRTGSLLVLYDPEKIPREKLMEAAAALEEQLAALEKTPGKGKAKGKKGGRGKKKKTQEAESCTPGRGLFDFGPGREGRRRESAVLGTLYGLTVLGGFVDRRVHIASGVLFTLLAASHVYQRRKCL